MDSYLMEQFLVFTLSTCHKPTIINTWQAVWDLHTLMVQRVGLTCLVVSQFSYFPIGDVRQAYNHKHLAGHVGSTRIDGSACGPHIPCSFQFSYFSIGDVRQANNHKHLVGRVGSTRIDGAVCGPHIPCECALDLFEVFNIYNIFVPVHMSFPYF